MKEYRAKNQFRRYSQRSFYVTGILQLIVLFFNLTEISFLVRRRHKSFYIVVIWQKNGYLVRIWQKTGYLVGILQKNGYLVGIWQKIGYLVGIYKNFWQEMHRLLRMRQNPADSYKITIHSRLRRTQ